MFNQIKDFLKPFTPIGNPGVPPNPLPTPPPRLMDDDIISLLEPIDPETHGKYIFQKIEWKGEIIPIRWYWCNHCQGSYIECRCGNCLCNGCASCEDCKEFYEIQSELFKNKQDPPRQDFVNKVMN